MTYYHIILYKPNYVSLIFQGHSHIISRTLQVIVTINLNLILYILIQTKEFIVVLCPAILL